MPNVHHRPSVGMTSGHARGFCSGARRSAAVVLVACWLASAVTGASGWWLHSRRLLQNVTQFSAGGPGYDPHVRPSETPSHAPTWLTQRLGQSSDGIHCRPDLAWQSQTCQDRRMSSTWHSYLSSRVMVMRGETEGGVHPICMQLNRPIGNYTCKPCWLPSTIVGS